MQWRIVEDMNTALITRSTSAQSRTARGVARSVPARIGAAIAYAWRDTQYANRRLVELQQPWRYDDPR